MDSICSITPIVCSEIKKGHYIIIKSRPCKIMDFSHAKTGKHGHIKVHLIGLDIITRKKCEWVGAGHLTLMEFKLIKKEYQLLMIDGEKLTCLDDNAKEVYVSINEDSDVYAELRDEINSDKSIIISVFIVPIEASADRYVDDMVIDNYKEAAALA